jgi:hypothetical protein
LSLVVGWANSAIGLKKWDGGNGRKFLKCLMINIAQMAELVDALVSGTSIRKYVQVRVLFWAQSGIAAD